MPTENELTIAYMPLDLALTELFDATNPHRKSMDKIISASNKVQENLRKLQDEDEDSSDGGYDISWARKT